SLVDLHGIPAAHREMWLRAALEVTEFAPATGAAVRASRHAYVLEPAGPHVTGKEAALGGRRLADQHFDRGGGLERRDHAGGRTQHSRRVTSLLRAAGAIRNRGVAAFQQTGEARRFAGTNGRSDAVGG